MPFVETHPLPRGPFPFLRYFTQHCETRTHIFPALVIVCGGREQGVRKRGVARRGGDMKIVERQTEYAWIESDVVSRKQPPVAIKGGILHRFGGHRRGELIESPDRLGRLFWHIGSATG